MSLDLIRILQNLYLSYEMYTCISEHIQVFRSYMYITKLIRVLRNLCRSYGTYTGISEHILVFRILYVYYRTYTCLTELIPVLQNLYWYFRAHTCISDLIRVLMNLYMYFRSYTCITKHILVFQILFLYEGIRRHDKSEHIRIISHTRSDQTYTDTDISPSLVQITSNTYTRFIQIQNISQNKQSCRFILESSLDLYIFLCL